MDFFLYHLVILLKLPFSKGQLIFASIFLLLFVILMIFAYKSDKDVNRVYYKDVWKILLAVLAIFGVIISLVKILH